MGSDVRFVKSERKVKKLKVRVSELETSMSSWEERLMEIDQQHQNMFSQYNKKICKLSSELESVRTKMKSGQRRIRELEEKLEMQSQVAESSSEEVPISTQTVADLNEEKSEGPYPGPSSTDQSKVRDDDNHNQNHSQHEIDQDDGPMSTDEMCRTLNDVGTTLEPSTSPAVPTTVRTSSRLREKRHLQSPELESFKDESSFQNSFNETVEIESVSSSHSMSEGEVAVVINPEYLYLDTSTLSALSEEAQGHIASEYSHETKPYACPYCPSMFEEKEDLDNHVNSHELPYKCHLCPKKFGLDIGLDAHLEKAHFIKGGNAAKGHGKTGRPRCGLCQQTYGSNWALKKHLENVHGRGKDRSYYECDLCNRKCVSKDSLRAHIMLVHRGEKPFSCLACDRAFSRKLSLSQHVCNPNTPICSECGKGFTTWKQVSGHMTLHRKKASVHKNVNRNKVLVGKNPSEKIIKMMRVNKNTVCILCKFKYATVKSYRRHLRRQHPEILKKIDFPKDESS